MISTIPRKTFYFLRHGETDHNVHKIYDDVTEIPLNKKGCEQAERVQKILAPLPLSTVHTSPLLRAQQTKEIALNKKEVQEVVLDDLRECQSELWRLFIAWESRPLTIEEWNSIEKFILRVKRSLEIALKSEGPTMIIAHGGTYWALSHILSLPGDRKINNCVPMKVFPVDEIGWKSESLLLESSYV